MDIDPVRVYPFVKPNPSVGASQRFSLALFAGLCLLMVALYLTDPRSNWDLLLTMMFATLACLLWPVVTALQYRFGKGVALGPQGIVIQCWLSKGEYPWHDIGSVRLGDRSELPWLNRQLWSMFIGRGCRVPYVSLTLRRAIRVPLWGRHGSRAVGLFMPGNKTVRIFVQDPAAFVEAAQAYLQPSGT